MRADNSISYTLPPSCANQMPAPSPRTSGRPRLSSARPSLKASSIALCLHPGLTDAGLTFLGGFLFQLHILFLLLDAPNSFHPVQTLVLARGHLQFLAVWASNMATQLASSEPARA